MKMKQGASVGIFSPSYIMVGEAPAAAQRAEDFLRENGFRVTHGRLWGRQNAYRTGTPQERAEEFNSLLRDPAVDILMASAGGFVTNGMLPYIDYGFFAANPKPVVGMSDVTVLLLALYAKTGIPTYYGTIFVTSYARLSPYREIALQTLCDVLNAEGGYRYRAPEFYSDEVIDWTKPLTAERQNPNRLVTMHGGKVCGRLIGGNLWSLANIWGTPYMPEIRAGDILFLEDTEVGADLVENNLAHLMLCGVFERLGGLMLGKCRDYADLGTAQTYYDFVYDCIGRPDYPVLADCDFSHCAPMLTLPVGITAELDADAQTLVLIR